MPQQKIECEVRVCGVEAYEIVELNQGSVGGVTLALCLEHKHNLITFLQLEDDAFKRRALDYLSRH
jgi:hypothetical protein